MSGEPLNADADPVRVCLELAHVASVFGGDSWSVAAGADCFGMRYATITHVASGAVFRLDEWHESFDRSDYAWEDADADAGVRSGDEDDARAVIAAWMRGVRA